MYLQVLGLIIVHGGACDGNFFDEYVCGANTLNGVDTPNSELEGYPMANILKKFGKTKEISVLNTDKPIFHLNYPHKNPSFY